VFSSYNVSFKSKYSSISLLSLLPTSHNGIAQDWNSWPLGAPRFDSWRGRMYKAIPFSDVKIGDNVYDLDKYRSYLHQQRVAELYRQAFEEGEKERAVPRYFRNGKPIVLELL
jgi:hypothetical protein